MDGSLALTRHDGAVGMSRRSRHRKEDGQARGGILLEEEEAGPEERYRVRLGAEETNSKDGVDVEDEPIWLRLSKRGRSGR